MTGIPRTDQAERNAWDNSDEARVDDCVEYLSGRAFGGGDLVAVNLNGKQIVGTPAQVKSAALEILTVLDAHEVKAA